MMEAVPVNYLAILICGVASMAIGFAWYSKALFGKAWMKEAGISEAQVKEANQQAGTFSSKKMGMMYGLMFVGSLVMAWVLAHAIVYAQHYLSANAPLIVAVMTAIFSWLGFVATVGLSMVLFEGKSWKLYGITTGYYLVQMVVMGVIFGYMQ